MTPQEKEHIRHALKGVGQDIRIRLHESDDEPGRAIREFCEMLQALCPEIRIDSENSNESVSFFEIAENVAYQAIPLSAELPPFLDFLTGAEKGNISGLPEGELLSRIKAPALLTVFIAPQCPHCPHTVAALLALANACKNVHVRVTDGEMFVQAAADAKVRSAPTTILDDDFRWTGAVDLREIVDAIINRNPARLSAATLQQMIEEKSPEAVSRMMLSSGEIYPGFIDLLTHEKWSVRLGAMVVFEFINSESDALARDALNALWKRFESAADDVKGDILYLYGESGRPEIRARLTGVQSGSYAEAVREAATEALETLGG